jgi:hypothetical protein
LGKLFLTKTSERVLLVSDHQLERAVRFSTKIFRQENFTKEVGMKGLVVVGTLAVLLVALTGCVSPVGAPIMGAIYTDVTGPGQIGDLSAGFSKVGQAEATGIILFATGDASINTAARSAGITKVHHVDVQYMSVLGVYGKTTTTVYGQ